jgi:hypothetical protein
MKSTPAGMAATTKTANKIERTFLIGNFFGGAKLTAVISSLK